MINKLTTGIELSLETTVREADTARSYGSGLLEVYATPAMIAFMERTSMELVQDYLSEGFGTVGIRVELNHVKASPVGAKVVCRSTLIKISDRKLSFEVVVSENGDTVGSGIHDRFIIDEKKFIAKLNQQ
jgi:predicted thioesterase